MLHTTLMSFIFGFLSAPILIYAWEQPLTLTLIALLTIGGALITLTLWVIHDII